MKLRTQKFGWITKLVSFLFAGGLLMASITPSWVLAQSSDDPWQAPINLSQSGSGHNPGFVMDTAGIGHAVWQNELEDYFYSRFDGEQWSAPVLTDLKRLFRLPITPVLSGPAQIVIYNGPNPVFLTGREQTIFAVWLSSQGDLTRSKVNSPDFNKANAWDTTRVVARNTGSFAVTVDEAGELHVVYLRMEGDSISPAGIYYTHSQTGGSNWTKPVLLYVSPYLRTVTEGEANLGIATATTGDALHVYVVWDNRPRKQVFLAQSSDGGQTWGQSTLVAGPIPDSGLDGPFNIRVGTDQDSVVLVWQNGRPGGTCSQLFQSSSDAGATWSEPQPIIEDLLGCANSNEFVKEIEGNPEAPLYFLTETNSQALLTAWNGSQWSQPQVQNTLSGFEEPEIFTQVIYACHHIVLRAERLYVVGCDKGDGGDVWATSRDLRSSSTSLDSPAWSQLSAVNNDSAAFDAVNLVATNDGLFHAFISQRDDPSIYYSNWDGELWSRITPVVELPDGVPGLPAIATGPENDLFVAAASSNGAIYFSRVSSGGAAVASNWSTPTLLEAKHNGKIGSVDIARDSAGTLYVAYAVPVNDERGIYLVLSKDQGSTWTEPLLVFDGTAAGFDFVGAPSLLISDDASLHLVWKVQSISGDGVPQPLSLYYSRSQDDGQSYSTPQLVVEDPVAWQEIVTDGEGNLHLFWQLQDAPTTVWDQVSTDGGSTWEYPKGLPDAGMPAAVARDSEGNLQLIGIGPQTLEHRLWDGSGWQPETAPAWHLVSEQGSRAELLTSAVNEQGQMMVLLAKPSDPEDPPKLDLLYSVRTLQVSVNQDATPVAPTPTIVPPTQVPATSTSEAVLTPTTMIESVPSSTPGSSTLTEPNNLFSPLTMALVPVALLLVSVLGLAIWRAARAKDR